MAAFVWNSDQTMLYSK